jgi:hypothetical protein
MPISSHKYRAGVARHPKPTTPRVRIPFSIPRDDPATPIFWHYSNQWGFVLCEQVSVVEMMSVSHSRHHDVTRMHG